MQKLLIFTTLLFASLAYSQAPSTDYKVAVIASVLMRDIGATPVKCPPMQDQKQLGLMCGLSNMTDLDAIYAVDNVFNTDAAATEWEYRPWNDSYNRSYWVDNKWLHLLVVPIDKASKQTYLLLYSSEPGNSE